MAQVPSAAFRDGGAGGASGPARGRSSPGEPSDLDLLARYRAGDVGAMDLLVDRHAGAVYAFVRRFLGEGANAEDLTQEVWLRVLRHADQFDGRSQLTTWLFTVTRNTCIDWLRRQQRRSARLEAPAAEPDGEACALDAVVAPGPPIVERVARRELSALVEGALGELSPSQREVFLLREQTDLSFHQIAALLEVPRETVKSRMRYALAHLRRLVRERLGREVTTVDCET